MKFEDIKYLIENTVRVYDKNGINFLSYEYHKEINDLFIKENDNGIIWKVDGTTFVKYMDKINKLEVINIKAFSLCQFVLHLIRSTEIDIDDISENEIHIFLDVDINEFKTEDNHNILTLEDAINNIFELFGTPKGNNRVLKEFIYLERGKSRIPIGSSYNHIMDQLTFINKDILNEKVICDIKEKDSSINIKIL